jgi:DnaA family protein
VPQQLTFELAPPESPGFDNFLPGRNVEACAALERFARGEAGEPGMLLWGAPGVGKSHLLAAAADAAQRAGRYARHLISPELAPAAAPELGALIAVDEVHRASPSAQGNLFTLYNALAATGGQLVVASATPPAQLALRPDLRTRLTHGLVYEIVALEDDAKPAALARYAAAHGFRLDEGVIAYLLAHYPRDMGSLLRTLRALDRHSLAAKRPITVPFVRETLGAAPSQR